MLTLDSLSVIPEVESRVRPSDCRREVCVADVVAWGRGRDDAADELLFLAWGPNAAAIESTFREDDEVATLGRAVALLRLSLGGGGGFDDLSLPLLSSSAFSPQLLEPVAAPLLPPVDAALTLELLSSARRFQ